MTRYRTIVVPLALFAIVVDDFVRGGRSYLAGVVAGMVIVLLVMSWIDRE